MDEFNFQAQSNNSRISEIKDIPTKKEKNKLPIGSFVIFLVLCIIVSSVSGAGSAFFMFKLLSVSQETQIDLNEHSLSEHSLSEEQNTQINAEVTEIYVTEKYEEATIVHEISDSQNTTYYNEETTLTAEKSLTKGEIYSKALNSIFSIKSTYNQRYNSLFGSYTRPITSTGTGFAVSDNGYIITNYHVVENGMSITVTDYDGNDYPAVLVGSEPKNDVAVLKIDVSVTAVEMGNSSELSVGDDIMVIGNALGELSYSFTDGIVSHLSRQVNVLNETINMFQTNAAINKGNSGGPVYNMNGEVIGIASAKYSSNEIEGLGFCIPIDDVKQLMTDIILYGYVKNKPYLGVSLQTVNDAIAARYSLVAGCYVVAIDETSDAYTKGLKTGDVITKINDKTISSCDDMTAVITELKAGDSISIVYWRNSEYHQIQIVLSEKKPSESRTQYSNVVDY